MKVNLLKGIGNCLQQATLLFLLVVVVCRRQEPASTWERIWVIGVALIAIAVGAAITSVVEGP